MRQSCVPCCVTWSFLRIEQFEAFAAQHPDVLRPLLTDRHGDVFRNNFRAVGNPVVGPGRSREVGLHLAYFGRSRYGHGLAQV